MQCTSFLPGCYSRGDPNVCANGGVFPLYNNERTLVSGNSYKAFLPPPNSDQFLVYQKDVLRQTMLNHECIFRDQVHELHRLYRRQRELMEEIKKKELSKQNLQLQTSQSNPFLPKISSESSQNMCPIPSLTWLNPAASRLLSISGVDNFQTTSFLWKSTTTGPNAAQTEGNLKDCKFSHSECRKPKKKMLDLELPADEYIDSDEDDLLGQEYVSNVPNFSPKRIPEASQKGDLKLVPSHRLVNSICQVGHLSPVPFPRSDDLTDLNYPICLNDGASSNSINNLGSETYAKGIFCQDQDQSNLGFRTLSKQIVSCIQTGRAVVTCLKSMQVEKDSQQELLPHIDEAGQTICNLNSFPQVSSSGKLCTPFKQLKVELPAEFPMVNPLDESGRKLQDQGTNSVGETRERKHDLSNDDYRGLASSCLPTLYKHVPQCDVTKSVPSVSSQRKPNHNLMQNPMAVQALPCFNIAAPSSKSTKSSDVSPPFNKKRSHCSRNISRPTVGSLNPLGDSFCAESMADACLQSISLDHLNYSAVTCSSPEVETICFSHSSGRDASSVKVMDLNFPPSFLLNSEVFQQNVGTEDGVKKLEDSQAMLPGSREKLYYSNKPDEDRGDLSRADLVFSQPLPTSISSICDFKPERFNTSECSDAPEGKDIIVNSKLSGVGKQFDLNSCVDDSSPTPSIPNVILKTVAEIDPEAPVSPENKECSPPRGESEDNQLGTPVQLSKQEDGDQNNELVRMAAEAIVLISTTWFQQSLIENTAGKTLEDSHCDSLHWFAGLVFSVAGDLENGAGVVRSGEHDRYHQELSSDGSDYFEAMTLELTETKVEDYCCKSYDVKHERSCVVSSRRQPRRERTRRVRQRKDFQAEVLPSLASLSRNEVTMDLQMIGGLMEAAGLPAETSLARRNAGRGSRPRRWSGNFSCHKNDIELLVTGERTLKGWGKTNRRRRGPRIAASNPQHILSSYVYHQ